MWDKGSMKRRTVVFLILLVACGMAASYVSRLIVAQGSARMTFRDKTLLGVWMDVLRDYSEMQDLPSRADAVQRWAKTYANELLQQEAVERWDGYDAPAWLTPVQARAIRIFINYGLQSGELEPRDFSWENVLVGQFPDHDKKPSQCLKPHFLDQYQHEPPLVGFPRPEDVAANRDGLEQLARNRELVDLIDECWEIGYRAGRTRSQS
jgi:hypothetical protein